MSHTAGKVKHTLVQLDHVSLNTSSGVGHKNTIEPVPHKPNVLTNSAWLVLQELRAGGPGCGQCTKEHRLFWQTISHSGALAARADGAALPPRAGRARPGPGTRNTAEPGVPNDRWPFNEWAAITCGAVEGLCLIFVIDLVIIQLNDLSEHKHLAL
jgi:hypothetical protein